MSCTALFHVYASRPKLLRQGFSGEAQTSVGRSAPSCTESGSGKLKNADLLEAY